MAPPLEATSGPSAPDTTADSVDARIERLSAASLTRIVEPDLNVPGSVGDGQILPDELLTLWDVPELFETLTPEQKRAL